MKKFGNVDVEKLQEVANTVYSWSKLHEVYFGKGCNKRTKDKFIAEFDSLIKTDHFTKNGKAKSCEILIKACPVCCKEFETKSGLKEKVTCSHGCANSHFRSGEDHPNWKDKEKQLVENEYSDNLTDREFRKKYSSVYRKICFSSHKHECIICNERNIIDVHHFDGNKNNNNPENLVPLCANHHRYIHSKKLKHLIEDKVNKYVEEFNLSLA